MPIRTSSEVFDYSLRVVVWIGDADSASIEATLETAESQTRFKWSGMVSTLSQRHDWRLAQGCRLGVGSHQGGNLLFRSVQIRAEASGVWRMESEAPPSISRGALAGTHNSFTEWTSQYCEKQMKFHQQFAKPMYESFYRNRLDELRSSR